MEYQAKINAKETANKDKAAKGEGYTVFDSTEEAVDYIQTKKELGLPLDANDARMLVQSMKQMKEGGHFAKEIENFIWKNKDKFQSLKIEGLDFNKKESITALAQRLSAGSCFINTMFSNIVLSSVTDGAPKSWGDMYLKALENGLISKNDGISSTQYMNTRKGVQAWVDGIIGKDVNGNSKLKVDGYFKNERTPDMDVMQKIQQLATRGVFASGGRVKESHSMMQFLTNGTWGVYDTGRPSLSTPREFGNLYTNWYTKPSVIDSYWILLPK